MLWTLGVILLILWLLGLMIGYTMGGFIQRGSAWLSPFRVLDKNFFARCVEVFEPGPGSVVSLEPQPFLQCHPSAPKTQWVMGVAHWISASFGLNACASSGEVSRARGRLAG